MVRSVVLDSLTIVPLYDVTIRYKMTQDRLGRLAAGNSTLRVVMVTVKTVAKNSGYQTAPEDTGEESADEG
jgi:hypothetical protein